ncbi:MAG TPA: ester cyclase, partial [Woeseiaceae bacterium]
MSRLFLALLCISLLLACSPKESELLAANKALVREFVDIGNARQFDRLAEVVADDFVRHSQATPGLVITNRDAFRAFMEQDILTFPDSQV